MAVLNFIGLQKTKREELSRLPLIEERNNNTWFCSEHFINGERARPLPPNYIPIIFPQLSSAKKRIWKIICNPGHWGQFDNALCLAAIYGL